MSSSTVPLRASAGAPMDADLLAVLRTMLEQQRNFRIEQLVALARPGSPGRFGSAIPEVSSTLERGARAALQEVQQALWRMDEGRYGLCTGCGDPVTVARLEILPQAALCMGCERARR